MLRAQCVLPFITNLRRMSIWCFECNLLRKCFHSRVLGNPSSKLQKMEPSEDRSSHSGTFTVTRGSPGEFSGVAGTGTTDQNPRDARRRQPLVTISPYSSALVAPPRSSKARFGDSVLGQDKNHVLTLKVLVIGDPGVGKTAFINYYVGGKFYNNYRQTIGVDFFHKMLRLRNGQLVRLQLWDIAGQERQRKLFRVYYRDANGCLLLFDLTNRQSFAHIEEWKDELDRQCSLPNGNNIPCLLLGNKADLPHDESYALQVEKLAQKSAFIGFRHVSAKDGTNISDSIELLADTMIRGSLTEVVATTEGPTIVLPVQTLTNTVHPVPIYDRSCC